MAADWSGTLISAAQGLGMAAPIVGVIIAFHRLRLERLSKIENHVDAIDADLTGLTAQLRANEVATERRFLPRDEFTLTVNRLDGSIKTLNETMLDVNKNLIDLAVHRR